LIVPQICNALFIYLFIHREKGSDVNKDLTFKAKDKDKDQTFKAKDQDKD